MFYNLDDLHELDYTQSQEEIKVLYDKQQNIKIYLLEEKDQKCLFFDFQPCAINMYFNQPGEKISLSNSFTPSTGISNLREIQKAKSNIF